MVYFLLARSSSFRPSTPAKVGALEVGALAALDLLHVASEPALAFALLYHAMQVLPLIVVGLVIELKLVLGREPDEPSPECEALATGPCGDKPERIVELPTARSVGR